MTYITSYQWRNVGRLWARSPIGWQPSAAIPVGLCRPYRALMTFSHDIKITNTFKNILDQVSSFRFLHVRLIDVLLAMFLKYWSLHLFQQPGRKIGWWRNCFPICWARTNTFPSSCHWSAAFNESAMSRFGRLLILYFPAHIFASLHVF